MHYFHRTQLRHYRPMGSTGLDPAGQTPTALGSPQQRTRRSLHGLPGKIPSSPPQERLARPEGTEDGDPGTKRHRGGQQAGTGGLPLLREDCVSQQLVHCSQ